MSKTTYPTLIKTGPTTFVSQEQRDGMPDFIIWRARQGAGGVCLKMRTAQKPWWFDTLAEAREYAQGMFPYVVR